MPNLPRIPLHLCQLLEEEYINLHRQLREKPTWSLRVEHLVASPKKWVRKVASADDQLSKYIMMKCFADVSIDALTDQQIVDEVNKLLTDPGFYEEERFAKVIRRDETQELIKLGLQNGDTILFMGDDAVHFNRLLIEDAYPDSIRRIYDLRLAEIYSRIHAESPSALCLSGGGIRSGSFALGIIQSLARHGLLDQFTYLSTVSGGGYIGSWLSAWIKRHPKGIEGVTKELSNEQIESKLEPEPEPVRYLRSYSNFLTPRLGLLSADVWGFVAIYVRNLILNWLVFIPFLLAVLSLPRIGLAIVQEAPITEVKAVFFVLGSLLSSWAIAFVSMNRPSSADALKANGGILRNLTGQKHFLIYCLAPLCLSAMLLSAFWAWLRHHRNGSEDLETQVASVLGQYVPASMGWMLDSWFIFILYGFAIHLVGWAIYAVWLRRFSVSELLTVVLTGPLGGWLLWLMATKAFPGPIPPPEQSPDHVNPTTGLFVCFALPLFMATLFLAASFFVGISSRKGWSSRFAIEDEDREWLARFGGWLLIVIVAWGIFSPVVIFGPLAIHRLPAAIAAMGGISGLFAVLAGRSSKTPAITKSGAQGKLSAVLMQNALTISAFAFLVFFAAVLSFVTSLIVLWLFSKSPVVRFSQSRLMEGITTLPSTEYIKYVEGAIFDSKNGLIKLMQNIYYPPWWFIIALAIVFLGFGLLMALLINLNKFSLHAAYRDRMIRAFLGASRTNHERKPNPFTGFDPSDNVQMHELRPGLLRDASFKDEHQKDDHRRIILFIKKLKDADESPNSVSAFIVSRLSPETQDMMKNYTGFGRRKPRMPSPSLTVNLIEDLNRILESEPLYEITSVGDTQMTRDVREMLGQFSLAEKNLAMKKIIEGLPSTTANKEIKDIVGDKPLRGDYLILLNRLLLHEFYKDEIKPPEYPPPPYRLMHVVNTALNLVSGDKLAWQQRKAETFSFSPLHCGSIFVGYRRSREYGGKDGVSLGTAAAISGAAVNSNMGYYSSSAVIPLILTLFNARLGWWLGNPGPAGNDYYHLAYPKSAIYPVLAEAFGWTDDKDSYVLLSDGGHFENLGLYEMVLRRCRVIVVVDGSGDGQGKFTDLGNAVRKVRIDLGIPIDFKCMPIYPRREKRGLDDTSEKLDGTYWALGTVQYSCVDKVKERDSKTGDQKWVNARDGFLIYIKPAFYGREPRDVYNYAKVNKEFPHESTGDQWFDEPQFESHRMLGSYIMDEICKGNRGSLTMTEFVNLASAVYKEKESQ